ncbi:hypothetical protein MUG78_17715 [Gordonia alkaliphila]|uniref:hypothetical protein n=1 Tax=Gordonia alkaliphila TaxID=1053547 RepID=UPI001FF33E23|nr:hypothetical protein [Gordonia alkaliphila]MCK0441239.1 hypothetical protein [Gordonia alkaliphila]
MTELDVATEGYVQALLLTYLDDTHADHDQGSGDGPFLDRTYVVTDVHASYMEAWREVVAAFINENESDVREYVDAFSDGREGWSMIGYDLLLTRSGHGPGFWDRGLTDVGGRLAGAALALGQGPPLEIANVFNRV